MSVLRGEALRRSFGAVRAADGVDIDVGAGEVVGLLGPNGAGKSTVFQMLAGLQTPDSGRVWLGDSDVTGWPLHRRARAGLAWLPQHPSLLPRLSAADNVAVALHNLGRDPAMAREMLEAAGLGELCDRPAGVLSGGERRRVEIVRALALQPRVMLLDEPFAGVDPGHVARVRTRIRELATAGIGVLLTDHAVRDAMPTCDRVLLLDTGVVQVRGTPAQVAQNSRARDRYLGSDFRLDL